MQIRLQVSEILPIALRQRTRLTIYCRKHVQKHEKPYKCKVVGCRREGGFTTPNDLARHMKSVHKIGGSTKSYRCAARICKSKSKVWPRLDNFKQHCSRMHKEEDQNLLISRYAPSNLRDRFGLLLTAIPDPNLLPHLYQSLLLHNWQRSPPWTFSWPA
jgi:hypothetical protein